MARNKEITLNIANADDIIKKIYEGKSADIWKECLELVVTELIRIQIQGLAEGNPSISGITDLIEDIDKISSLAESWSEDSDKKAKASSKSKKKMEIDSPTAEGTVRVLEQLAELYEQESSFSAKQRELEKILIATREELESTSKKVVEKAEEVNPFDSEDYKRFMDEFSDEMRKWANNRRKSEIND